MARAAGPSWILVVGTGVLLGATLTVRSARADDPQLSACIAANESSIQRLDAHKLREARELSQKCATDPCPAMLRDACKKRLDRVGLAIPTISFDVRDASGASVAVARVTMDGEPVAARGTVEADPGDHTFSFEVEGQAPVAKTFTLRDGEKDRRETIVLPALAPVPAAPLPALPPVTPDTGTASSWNTSKTLALVAGGVGVAGLAVGSVFGLMAHSRWSSSQSECASPTSCPEHAQAVSDHDSAASSATVSTIAFAAGGAAIVGGAVLWLTAPHAETARTSSLQITPAAGPGTAGLVVMGAF